MSLEQQSMIKIPLKERYYTPSREIQETCKKSINEYMFNCQANHYDLLHDRNNKNHIVFSKNSRQNINELINFINNSTQDTDKILAMYLLIDDFGEYSQSYWQMIYKSTIKAYEYAEIILNTFIDYSGGYTNVILDISRISSYIKEPCIIKTIITEMDNEQLISTYMYDDYNPKVNEQLKNSLPISLINLIMDYCFLKVCERERLLNFK